MEILIGFLCAYFVPGWRGFALAVILWLAYMLFKESFK